MSLLEEAPAPVGHNSIPCSEELVSDRGKRNKKLIFLYEIRSEVLQTVERGEIEAEHEEDAWRRLRLQRLAPRLRSNTRIWNKVDGENGEQRKRSNKLRRLLRALASHHRWLAGGEGERADLSGLDLSRVSLRNRDLSHANLASSDLTEADLSGIRLAGANLAGANLSRADLSGANLRNVDLSHANFCQAVLIDADLKGADLWRANLSGCVIAPTNLHRALGCRKAVGIHEVEAPVS
jgi:uncharacterized protein YjbI with pentapeptide repeats